MMSKTRQQIVTLHILHNISRSKDNQAIKFGHVIEYNRQTDRQTDRQTYVHT